MAAITPTVSESKAPIESSSSVAVTTSDAIAVVPKTLGSSDGRSLAQIFLESQSLHTQIGGMECDDKQQELVSKVFLQFMQCANMIKTSGIFSTNESLDDISTMNLKYLLCSWYIADCLDKFCAREKRPARVKKANEYLKEFMRTCASYGVMAKEDMEWEKKTRDRLRPDEKKLLFARAKGLEAKVAELRRRKEESLKRRTARGQEGEDEDSEEEHERAIWLAQIHLTIHQVQDQFVSIKREMEMFEFEAARAKMTPAEIRASQPPPPGAPAIWNVANPGVLRGPIPANMTKFMVPVAPAKAPAKAPVTAIGAPRAAGTGAASSLLPGMAGVRVTDLSAATVNPRDAVFRDPNPVTMDEETWFQAEVASGKIPKEFATGGGGAEAARAAAAAANAALSSDDEPSDDEAEEAKRKKDSAWADWTDDHERGAGNRTKHY